MRTNNIAPVLPYLVQFVLSSVTLENDCARQLKLLYVLQALLANRCLFMGHTPVVSTSRSIVHMQTRTLARFQICCIESILQVHVCRYAVDYKRNETLLLFLGVL